MTPDEFELRKVLRIYYASQTCENGVAAIQIFMWLYMLSQFVQASASVRKSRALYLAVSFILMALAIGNAVLGSLAVFDILFQAQPTNPDEGFKIWIGGYDRIGFLGDFLADIAIYVGDALLLYRCYVICFDCAWLTAIPAIIYLVDLGLAIKGYTTLWGSFGDDRIDAANIFLTVINNIILTSLMSWRLLRGHRQLSKCLPLVKHTLYTSAVAVLVESAAPIAVCGLGYGVVTALRRTMDTGYAFTVFTFLFQTSIALCPQLIIFRVAIGKSQAHRSDASELGGGIQFAGSASTVMTNV